MEHAFSEFLQSVAHTYSNVWVSLSLLGQKYPQFKDGRVYLGSRFQGFQSMVGCRKAEASGWEGVVEETLGHLGSREQRTGEKMQGI